MRVLGYAMAATGGLITLLSGGIMAAIIVPASADKKLGWAMIEPTLIFGLPVVAFGLGVLVGGVSMVRNG